MSLLARDGAAQHGADLAALCFPRVPLTVEHKLRVIENGSRAFFAYADEEVETLKTVTRMLDEINFFGSFAGDCDDASVFTAALLLTAGFRVRFVAIRVEFASPNFTHVFTEAFDGARWVRFDATVERGTQHAFIDSMTESV